MVLVEGMVLLVAGVAVGLAGAVLATQVLSSLVFGVSPHDTATLGVATLALGAVGLAARWLPAARAAHVDRAVALRAE